MVGKTDYAEALLADRLSVGDAAVVVTTDPGAVDVGALRAAAPDTTTPRLGVVGLDAGEAVDVPLREVVSSPGDLTGMTMALSNVLEVFAARPDDVRLWILFDSLTTVAAYTDPQRLYQFVHDLTGRVTEAGGVGLFTVHEEAMAPETVNSLGTLFDCRLEFEDGPEAARLRLTSTEQDGEWLAFDPDQRPRRDPTQRDVAPASTPDSLSAALSRLEAAGQTLTLYEFDGALAPFERYFEQFNVSVETARSDPDQGLRPFALLHRDGDVLAASPASDLRAAVDHAADQSASPFVPTESPDVLQQLDRSVFDTAAATRRDLIRVSRVFEMAALRAGSGVVHAGFQRLSRLADDDRARDIYRRLVEAGLDVHVYGERDASDPGVPGVTVHDAAAPELRASWFVVYDGGADASRAGALLAEEQDPGRYAGRWTHDPQFAATLDRYLRETYSAATLP